MNRLNKTNSGFTLVEVLIAITILSIMMIGVYSIVSNSIETKDRITLEDRELLQIQAALNRFDLDFSQIYSPLYFARPYNAGKKSNDPYADEDGYDNEISKPKFNKTEKFPSITSNGILIPLIENPDKHTLSFLTVSNRRKMENSKESKFGWVKYSLRTSESKDENRREGGNFELIRQFYAENPYSPDHEWDKVKEHLLVRNVKSLEFSFWESENGKFVTSIKDLNDNKNTPRSTIISVIWIDSNGNEHISQKSSRVLWPSFDPSVDLENQPNINNLNQNDPYAEEDRKDSDDEK